MRHSRFCYLMALALLSANTSSSAHSGRTNRLGCDHETAAQTYHYQTPKPAIHIPLNTQAINKKTSSNEEYYNQLLARAIDGKHEVIHTYRYGPDNGTIRVDIETNDYVIEGGLDKRSSLDSIQQALFAAHITGKKPLVVIYDTDGVEGRFEFRIKLAAQKSGIKFMRLTEADILKLTGL